MEISGSSIRHRTGVPKAQSSSETDSLNINPTSQTRTLQQTQTEADTETARQSEVLYERSVANEKEKDSPFEKFSNQNSEPTDAHTDSKDNNGNSTSSHQTKTDNATTQQTKAVKFLESVKWSWKYLPEFPAPDGRIALGDKIGCTALVLLVFMIGCQVPLFCIESSESVDHFYYMRPIWGSKRGSFMEFGIMPISESYGILLVLRTIILDDTPYNHTLLNGAERLLALLLTVVVSVLFIMTGMYGELDNIGVAILIGIQLFIGGLIILLLNDIMRKGYCLGTDIILLIVPNICGTIIWKAFSPVTVYTNQGAEFEGAVLFLLQCLFRKKDKMFNLRRAFLRQNLPNVLNFLAIGFVFIFFIYLKGFRVQLPMKSTKYKGQRSFYSIHLLYTSIAPLLMQKTFVFLLYLLSQVLSTNFSENFFTTLLGVWADERSDGLPRSYPIGGLCYYLSPPRTSLQVIQDPVYAVVYSVFVIGSCALMSMIWINFINMRAVDVATKLKEKNMIMLNQSEESMLNILEQYISTAAVVGGLCIGTLSVLADFLGVFGSGTGVILVANIIYDHFEIYSKEKKMQEEQNTMMF